MCWKAGEVLTGNQLIPWNAASYQRALRGRALWKTPPTLNGRIRRESRGGQGIEPHTEICPSPSCEPFKIWKVVSDP